MKKIQEDKRLLTPAERAYILDCNEKKNTAALFVVSVVAILVFVALSAFVAIAWAWLAKEGGWIHTGVFWQFLSVGILLMTIAYAGHFGALAVLLKKAKSNTLYVKEAICHTAEGRERYFDIIKKDKRKSIMYNVLARENVNRGDKVILTKIFGQWYMYKARDEQSEATGMIIESNTGDFECNTREQFLEKVLQLLQLEQGDEFWCKLSEYEEYPCMSFVSDKGEVVADYFTAEVDQYASVGDVSREGIVQFLGGQYDVEACQIISRDTAVACALEFFDTHEKPKCIQWEEL